MDRFGVDSGGDPQTIWRSLRSLRVWRRFARALGRDLEINSFNRWILSIGLGVGAAFSVAVHLGSIIGINVQYLEIFYLIRDIIVSPFAMLYLALPDWISWLFRRELGFLYSFIVFLIPFVLRGYRRFTAAKEGEENEGYIEVPEFLRRTDSDSAKTRKQRRMFDGQIKMATNLISLVSLLSLWIVWFGPVAKFFFRSLIEIFAIIVVFSLLIGGARSGYNAILVWIDEHEFTDEDFYKNRIIYDSIRAVWIAAFVAVLAAAAILIGILVFRNGNFATYVAVYAIVGMSIVSSYDEWRVIPSIMTSAILLLVGNIFVESVFNPSWAYLRMLVNSLPSYSV